MTPAEIEYNERVKFMLKLMHDESISTVERRRIAELIGLPRKQRGAPRKGTDTTAHLMTKEFSTPEGRKRLAEKLIGREIWRDPVTRKPGRPKGTRRDDRLEFAMHYQELKDNGYSQYSALIETTKKRGNRYVALEVARRLVREGRKEPYLSPEGIREMANTALLAWKSSWKRLDPDSFKTYFPDDPTIK